MSRAKVVPKEDRLLVRNFHKASPEPVEGLSHRKGEQIMPVFRAVVGAVLLFLGRELKFLLAAAMAALISYRLSPHIPAQWPGWSFYAVIGGAALVAAAIVIANERVGYFLSGFLAGGYYLMEYYAPGLATLPLLPFIMGGLIGSLILGLLTDWALMIVTALLGAYYITDLFRLTYTAKTLIVAGLFILGALTQAILMRMQKN